MQNAPNPQFVYSLEPDTRLAIVAAEWNAEIVDRLLIGVHRAAKELGIAEERLSLFRCPGSYEIPLIAMACAESGKFDAIIALGCVIRGETYHFELVADAVSEGLMSVMMSTDIPCLMGVLTTNTLEQALTRSGDGPDNKGWECVMAAAHMLRTLKQIRELP